MEIKISIEMGTYRSYRDFNFLFMENLWRKKQSASIDAVAGEFQPSLFYFTSYHIPVGYCERDLVSDFSASRKSQSSAFSDLPETIQQNAGSLTSASSD